MESLQNGLHTCMGNVTRQSFQSIRKRALPLALRPHPVPCSRFHARRPPSTSNGKLSAEQPFENRNTANSGEKRLGLRRPRPTDQPTARHGRSHPPVVVRCCAGSPAPAFPAARVWRSLHSAIENCEMESGDRKTRGRDTDGTEGKESEETGHASLLQLRLGTEKAAETR